MQQPISVFLGANSYSGFSSLYNGLLSARFDDLLILKGGPGCGKSTFMKALAQFLADAVPEQVHVPCSGDPDSLDAVLFPALRVGVVDGTSPHALEPTYPVANERVVDLTRFYDIAAVKVHRAEILLLTDTYRARYREVYRALKACGEVNAQRRSIVQERIDYAKLMRRMSSILNRELHGVGEGRADKAFLGGLTYQGDLCCYDTVTSLCPRVYELCDSYGLASPLFSAALERALSCGKRVLICPSSDEPTRFKHLLIPDCGLAFVTSDAHVQYPQHPYRRLRIDAIAEQRLTKAEKAQLHFLGRIEQALRDEACSYLKEAKLAHDALERAYHQYVDFDAVTMLAQEEAVRLQKQYN